MARNVSIVKHRRGQLVVPGSESFPDVMIASSDEKARNHVIYSKEIAGGKIEEGTFLEVLSPGSMKRWIPSIDRMQSGGFGLKGFYTQEWVRGYILPCMKSQDSLNLIVRKGDRLLGYLTGGPLEKYSLYHPRIGLGGTFMIVGLETAPGAGTGRGFGGRMVEKAVELAVGKGYRFLAGFTDNPRLKHIYDKLPSMVKMDERRNVRGWRNLTYVIDPDLVEACRESPEELASLRERELDLRLKRKVTNRREDELIFGLRGLRGRRLIEAARVMQDRLAV